MGHLKYVKAQHMAMTCSMVKNKWQFKVMGPV